MNTLIEILNSISGDWWRWIAASAWQSALVAALILSIVRIGRRWPSPLKHALLLVALAKFAVPPMLSLPSGLFSQVGPNISSISLPPNPPEIQSRPEEGLPLPSTAGEAVTILLPSAPITPALNHDADQVLAPTLLDIQSPALDWKTILMLIHGIGIAITSAWLIREARAVNGIRHRAHRVVEGELFQSMEETVRRLRLRRLPELRISAEIGIPAAFGLFRPTILLPKAAIERLSHRELRAILAHESAHFRRGDLWSNLLQSVLIAVWWFHPFVWCVRKSIRTIREECCDDLLLDQRLVTDEEYCQVLVSSARELTNSHPGPIAIGFGEGKHPLGARIGRIMDAGLRRHSGLPRLGVVTVLIISAVLLPGVKSQTVVKEDPAQQTTLTPVAAPLQQTVSDNSLATADVQRPAPFQTNGTTSAVAGTQTNVTISQAGLRRLHEWNSITYPRTALPGGVYYVTFRILNSLEWRGDGLLGQPGTIRTNPGIRLDIECSLTRILEGVKTLPPRLIRENGTIVEKLGLVTGPAGGMANSPLAVIVRFPWGESQLEGAWIDVELAGSKYLLEIPYGFTRDPLDPPTSSATNGAPRVPSLVSELASHAQVLFWDKVIYGPGMFDFELSNPFFPSADTHLRGPIDLFSPTARLSIEDPQSQEVLLRGVRIGIRLDEPKRTDSYRFQALENASISVTSNGPRFWGMLHLNLDEQVDFRALIPSSLFSTAQGRSKLSNKK